MPSSRRTFIKSTPIFLTTALAGCSGSSNDPSENDSASRNTTEASASDPSPDVSYSEPQPVEDTPDSIIKEAQGELILTPKNPYWIWGVDSPTSCITVEYEVGRSSDSQGRLDILAVQRTGHDHYRTNVSEYPIYTGPSLSQENIMSGEVTPNAIIDNVHPGNVLKRAQQYPITEAHLITELTEKQLHSAPYNGPLYKQFTLEPGSYWVIFDGLHTTTHYSEGLESNEYFQSEVAIRGREPVDDTLEEETVGVIDDLATAYTDANRTVLSISEEIATELCENYESDLMDLSSKETVDPSHVRHTTNIAQGLLDLLSSKIGFSSARINQVLQKVDTWARWSSQLIPVVSSANQVLDDACSVVEASSENMSKMIRQFMVSIALLLVDLLLMAFGVPSKGARLVTSFIDEYLLGLLKQVLGTRVYLVLLREIYLLVLDSIIDALDIVKAMTERIADKHGFFSKDEVEAVDDMEEDSLRNIANTLGLTSVC